MISLTPPVHGVNVHSFKENGVLIRTPPTPWAPIAWLAQTLEILYLKIRTSLWRDTRFADACLS